MDNVKILEVKQSIFASNDEQAAALRAELKQEKIFLLNLMSAPGSGKTTTLRRTIAALQNELRIGVMEADIDSDVDARAIAETGAKAIQLHTGGMCHLDAEMTRQGLAGLGTGGLDLVILENVGNLVCPAEFDTGAVKNARSATSFLSTRSTCCRILTLTWTNAASMWPCATRTQGSSRSAPGRARALTNGPIG